MGIMRWRCANEMKINFYGRLLVVGLLMYLFVHYARQQLRIRLI
jgi:hypothetical protein